MSEPSRKTGGEVCEPKMDKCGRGSGRMDLCTQREHRSKVRPGVSAVELVCPSAPGGRLGHMKREIQITVGSVLVRAQLDESLTASAIWTALPLKSTANRWGDEIYFSVPVRLMEERGARQDMTVGELGYWPVGAAFCIFFGPTPVSDGPGPRAYSNVNPFGHVLGDVSVLRTVHDGDTVSVLAAP